MAVGRKWRGGEHGRYEGSIGWEMKEVTMRGSK